MVFLDAPLELPRRPGDSLGMRCWWRDGQNKKYDGWDRSLATLERAWDERGPFAGAIGFSQGAAVAFSLALLAETADRDAIARGVATDDEGASDMNREDAEADTDAAAPPRWRRFSSLDFFILCSGYVPAPSPVRNPHGITPVAGARIGEGTSPRACLVLAGEKDEAVPVRESLKTAAWFRDAETVARRDGKHEVSSRAADVDAVAAFVSRFARGDSHARGRSATGETTADKNAADAADASRPQAWAYGKEEVREELEALRAIFDEDMRDVSRAQRGDGGGTAARAPLAFAFSVPRATDVFGPELCSNPAFVLELPEGYPETEPPRVRAKRGLIGMAPRLAAAFREGLDVAVADATRDLLGTPSTFSAVSEAREWLDGAMRAYASQHPSGPAAAGGTVGDDVAEGSAEEEATATETASSSAPGGIAEGDLDPGDESSDDDAETAKKHRWWEAEDTEDDDAAVRAAIAEASAEAARAALADAEKRRGRLAGAASAERGASFVSPCLEKGGRWEYVIGLVGKPSAGKSTFYNSAAAFASSDANAAKVAAYPFTTVEPNVAQALAALPCACAARGWQETCQPAHGRVILDGAHKRLGRVRIKDVAGLVPGAHRGRGRGNAFLNDLCDADVLVHVVDASGRSDRDGVDHTGGGETSAAFFPKEPKEPEPKETPREHENDAEVSLASRDPAGDVGWVRDELHRWIFSNVRAKWRGVRRRPERLRELFSGYHCAPTVADAALRKCGVSDPRSPPRELIRGWKADHLHVLVAHFTRARFPMLLALNKSDLAESKAHAKRTRDAWPAETCVDVSARDDPTSVRRAVAAAIALKPPVLGFPVDCLDTGTRLGLDLPQREKKASLRECVLLKPGSTVEDFFAEARRTGACGNGELVRSETSDGAGRRRTLRRDEPVAAIPGGVVKFYVNRKVKWQGKR